MNKQAKLNELAKQTDVSHRSPRVLTQSEHLPVDWDMKNLDDISEIKTGHTPSRDVSEYWNGEIPWIAIHDLTQVGGIEINTTDEAITKEGLKNSGAKLLPEGTVALCRTGSIGASAILDREMATDQSTVTFECSPGKVNPYFLLYIFQQCQSELDRLGIGSTHPSIQLDFFPGLQIPVPPIEEQRKIASVLYTLDQLAQKTKEIAEQSDKVLRGLMNDVFEQGANEHETYQETPVGKFPSSWNMVQIEDLLLEDMSYGILKPGDYDEDGVRMIRATDIAHGKLVESHPFRVSQSKADEYKRTTLAESDVILSVMGTVGRSMCVPASLEGANLNRALARLRFDSDLILPEFVELWFRSPHTQSYFETQKFGTAQSRLNLGFLNKMKVPVPPMNEQRRIVEILSNADDQYWLERESESRLKCLKRGIMQTLLSGEVRTHNKKIEVMDKVLQYD